MDTIPRFRFIDGARGAALLLMAVVHGFDFWMRMTPDAIHSIYWKGSHFMGSLSAPLFLFLVGFNACLLIEKCSLTGRGPGILSPSFIRLFSRGWGIFLSGFLFNYVIFCFPDRKGHSVEETLLIVQILHCIGISLMLLSGMALIPSYAMAAVAALFLLFSTGGIAVWNLSIPAWVPAYGVTLLRGLPHEAFFPLFPWCCFAMAGFAAGRFFIAAWKEKRDGRCMNLMLFTGFIASLLGFSMLVLSGRTRDVIAMGMDEKVFYHMDPILVIFWPGAAMAATGSFHLLYAGNRRKGPPGLLEIVGRSAYFLYFFHYLCFRLTEMGGFTGGWHQGRLDAPTVVGAVIVFIPFLAASAWIWYGARCFLRERYGKKRGSVISLPG